MLLNEMPNENIVRGMTSGESRDGATFLFKETTCIARHFCVFQRKHLSDCLDCFVLQFFLLIKFLDRSIRYDRDKFNASHIIFKHIF